MNVRADLRTDQPYRRIRVEPTTGYLGAEVFGVDLSKPLDDETFAEVKRAWLENLVIAFRDQAITPPIIESFGARFGKLTITAYANSVPGYQFAHSLVRAADVPRGERNFGDSWHMDQTVRPIPNAGFLLCSVDCPPFGGDTGFASLYTGYEMLSEGMKALCESLVVIHSPSGLFGKDGMGGIGKKPFMLAGAEETYSGMTPEKVREYMAQETEQPLIAIHPETGRKLIMITGYCTRFRGMTEEESQPLLEYLTRHVSRPEYTWRLRWRRGTLALIDNRCLQHIAYQDYAGFRREMLRAEFEADEPPFGPMIPRRAATASKQPVAA